MCYPEVSPLSIKHKIPDFFTRSPVPVGSPAHGQPTAPQGRRPAHKAAARALGRQAASTRAELPLRKTAPEGVTAPDVPPLPGAASRHLMLQPWLDPSLVLAAATQTPARRRLLGAALVASLGSQISPLWGLSRLAMVPGDSEISRPKGSGDGRGDRCKTLPCGITVGPARVSKSPSGCPVQQQQPLLLLSKPSLLKPHPTQNGKRGWKSSPHFFGVTKMEEHSGGGMDTDSSGQLQAAFQSATESCLVRREP